MDMRQMIENLDQLIFANTEKHLSDLQKTIILGTFNQKKYQTIAEENHVSEDYIKRIASELWHQLGNILGEDVKKKIYNGLLKEIIIIETSQIMLFK
jgi:hypothetical protein